MLNVTLKSLWGHKRRLVGTVLAVFLGVAFLFVDIFMAVLSITGMFIAAVMNERRESEAALQHAHDDLERGVAERTVSLARTVADLQTEVSQRKSVEHTLRESEERFRLVVENVTDYAMFMLDPARRMPIR